MPRDLSLDMVPLNPSGAITIAAGKVRSDRFTRAIECQPARAKTAPAASARASADAHLNPF
jgi:hypothetical protein